MYIGGLNARGLGMLVDGIIEDLLDETDSNLTNVRLTLETGRSFALEITGEVGGLRDLNACAEPHPSSEADDQRRSNPYPFIGFVIPAALCSSMELEVVQRDYSWRQRAEPATVVHPPERIAFTGPPRISLRLQPDPGLFPSEVQPSFYALSANMQDHAVTHAGAKFSVVDATTDTRRDFQYPHGLRDYVAEIEPRGDSSAPVYHLAYSEAGDSAEAVIVHGGVGPGVIRTFVNGRRSVGGGSHVEGLASGIASVLRENPELPPSLDPNQPLVGMTIVLSVRLRDPQWEDAVGTVLTGTRAASLVREMVVKHLPAQMGQHQS